MAETDGKVKTRKMTASDLAKVNDIDRSLPLTSKDKLKRRVTTWPFSFDMYWRVYEPKLSFVAELNGKVVGFIAGSMRNEERSRSIISEPYNVDASVDPSGKVGWIEMMGVDPEYWSKGIGMALVDAFYAECQRNKASMKIVIRDNDEAMKGFLSTMKFKKLPTVTFEKST